MKATRMPPQEPAAPSTKKLEQEPAQERAVEADLDVANDSVTACLRHQTGQSPAISPTTSQAMILQIGGTTNYKRNYLLFRPRAGQWLRLRWRIRCELTCGSNPKLSQVVGRLDKEQPGLAGGLVNE
jgi:hypothetical protein